MTPEKLPSSRKYFSTELSPQGNSGAVFFCAWTLLKIWPIDTHLSFRKSAKDLASRGLSKIRRPPKFFWRSVLRVSTVRLGGEGKQVFELRIFATNLWHLRIWKKTANRNKLKIFARFSDSIHPEVSFSSWIVNFWSAFVDLLVFCLQVLSVSFISRSDYNQFLLEFLFDLRDHFLKKLNNISKHIHWTTLDYQLIKVLNKLIIKIILLPQ